MTIMWSTVSFTTYLLHFQLKFLHGNIFKNNNYSAVSDVVAIIFGGKLFFKFGIQIAFYIAFTTGIIGGFGILYLESIHW